MGYTEILYEVRDRIATVTLNRPDKLNAYTPTMGAELRAAMEVAAADDDVRVIVLTGAGRGFCAGADMTRLSGISAEGGMAADEVKPFDPTSRPDFQHRNTYFPAVPKPIIGAVNGACAGLGMALTLFCDMRFAADAAVFTTSFARRGLIAEHGISWTLPRLVGPSKAADLLLSGRKVLADEALRIGLVDHVVPGADLIDAVRAYATELATYSSPRSMRIMKRQLWNVAAETLDEAMKVADTEMHLSLGSDDFKEGVRHFLEKRLPNFTDR